MTSPSASGSAPCSRRKSATASWFSRTAKESGVRYRSARARAMGLCPTSSFDRLEVSRDAGAEHRPDIGANSRRPEPRLLLFQDFRLNHAGNPVRERRILRWLCTFQSALDVIHMPFEALSRRIQPRLDGVARDAKKCGDLGVRAAAHVEQEDGLLLRAGQRRDRVTQPPRSRAPPALRAATAPGDARSSADSSPDIAGRFRRVMRSQCLKTIVRSQLPKAPGSCSDRSSETHRRMPPGRRPGPVDSPRGSPSHTRLRGSDAAGPAPRRRARRRPEHSRPGRQPSRDRCHWPSS